MISARRLSLASPPNKKRLTSLAHVVEELGQFADGPVIERLIDRVSAELVGRFGYPAANGGGQPLAAAGYEEKVQLGEAEEEISLSRRFLRAAPAVTVNGEALDPDEIEANFSAGVLRRLSGSRAVMFPAGAVVVAEYDAGFLMPEEETPDIPADLEGAAIELLSLRRLAAGGADPCSAPIKSISLPGAGAVNFDVSTPGLEGALPAAVADAVVRYRFPQVGWR